MADGSREGEAMGLSGPIRTIPASAQRADVLFKHGPCAGRPTRDRLVPRIGRDLTLHVRSRNEEVR